MKMLFGGFEDFPKAKLPSALDDWDGNLDVVATVTQDWALDVKAYRDKALESSAYRKIAAGVLTSALLMFSLFISFTLYFFVPNLCVVHDVEGCYNFVAFSATVVAKVSAVGMMYIALAFVLRGVVAALAAARIVAIKVAVLHELIRIAAFYIAGHPARKRMLCSSNSTIQNLVSLGRVISATISILCLMDMVPADIGRRLSVAVSSIAVLTGKDAESISRCICEAIGKNMWYKPQFGRYRGLGYDSSNMLRAFRVRFPYFSWATRGEKSHIQMRRMWDEIEERAGSVEVVKSSTAVDVAQVVASSLAIIGLYVGAYRLIKCVFWPKRASAKIKEVFAEVTDKREAARIRNIEARKSGAIVRVEEVDGVYRVVTDHIAARGKIQTWDWYEDQDGDQFIRMYDEFNQKAVHRIKGKNMNQFLSLLDEEGIEYNPAEIESRKVKKENFQRELGTGRIVSNESQAPPVSVSSPSVESTSVTPFVADKATIEFWDTMADIAAATFKQKSEIEAVTDDEPVKTPSKPKPPKQKVDKADKVDKSGALAFTAQPMRLNSIRNVLVSLLDKPDSFVNGIVIGGYVRFPAHLFGGPCTNRPQFELSPITVHLPDGQTVTFGTAVVEVCHDVVDSCRVKVDAASTPKGKSIMSAYGSTPLSMFKYSTPEAGTPAAIYTLRKVGDKIEQVHHMGRITGASASNYTVGSQKFHVSFLSAEVDVANGDCGSVMIATQKDGSNAIIASPMYWHTGRPNRFICAKDCWVTGGTWGKMSDCGLVKKSSPTTKAPAGSYASKVVNGITASKPAGDAAGSTSTPAKLTQVSE